MDHDERLNTCPFCQGHCVARWDTALDGEEVVAMVEVYCINCGRAPLCWVQEYQDGQPVFRQLGTFPTLSRVRKPRHRFHVATHHVVVHGVKAS